MLSVVDTEDGNAEDDDSVETDGTVDGSAMTYGHELMGGGYDGSKWLGGIETADGAKDDDGSVETKGTVDAGAVMDGHELRNGRCDDGSLL